MEINSVELFSLYDELDLDIKTLKAATGLGCREGCGLCCLRPTQEIVVTVFEMIPLARELFAQGLAQEYWSLAREAGGESRCVFYQSAEDGGMGRCGRYSLRPLICRLFGFGAFRDKLGKLKLTVSRVMKEDHPEIVAGAQEFLSQGGSAPVNSDYATRLAGLEPSLTSRTFPLNLALVQALEWVSLRRKSDDDDTPPRAA